MKKNGTGKSNVKVEQVRAISVSDTKQTKTTQKSGYTKFYFIIPVDSLNLFSSSTEKDSESAKFDGSGDPQGSKKTLSGCNFGDASAATFLDVAVLRCLFITHWQEEGVYWALHYMYNRLRDISEDSANQQPPRRRSNSLPIPKIEVSVFQNDNRKQEAKDFIEVPEVKDVSPLAGRYNINFKTSCMIIVFRITVSQPKTDDSTS